MIYFQRLSILVTKIFVNSSYPTPLSVRFGISWLTDSVSPSLPNFSWGEEGLYTGYISLGINFVQLVQNKQYTSWGPQVVIRSTFLSSLDFLARYNWLWPQTNYRIYIRGVILGYKVQVSINQFRFGLKVSSVGSVKSTSVTKAKMKLSGIIAVVLALFLVSTAVGMSDFVKQNLFL